MKLEEERFLLPVVGCQLQNLLLAGKDENAMGRCLNTMLAGLEKRADFGEMLFSIYDGVEPIFHFSPIAGRHRAIHTSALEAIRELEWANEEMSRRYETMVQAKCRNVDKYNEVHGDRTMPRIVIIIHELADLMATDAAKTEKLLGRLLPRSQAAGIHVLCSTARIHTDVLTSRILASFINHLIFRMDSKEESELLGLKFYPLPKAARPYRGNTATNIGRAIEEAEKRQDATRLDANEAVYLHPDYYLSYENGRRKDDVRYDTRLIQVKE